MRRSRWSLSGLTPSLPKAPGGLSRWMVVAFALFTLGQLSPRLGFAATRSRKARYQSMKVEFQPAQLHGLEGAKNKADMRLWYSGFKCGSDGSLSSKKTPVVLLSGLGYPNGPDGAFCEVSNALREAGHSVIKINLLGNGESSGRRTFSMKIKDQSEAVAAALNRLGITRAHVVGHSYGGAVALDLAARNGDLVDKVVPINAAAYGLTLPPAGRVLAVPGLGALVARFVLAKEAKFTAFQKSHYHGLAEMDAEKKSAVKEAIAHNYTYFNQPGGWRAFHKATLSMLTDVMPGRFAAILPAKLRKKVYGDAVNETWKRDVLDVVRKQNEAADFTKVLALWGSYDRLTPLDTAGFPLAKALGAKLMSLLTGHNAPGQAPDEVARHIIEFID